MFWNQGNGPETTTVLNASNHLFKGELYDAQTTKISIKIKMSLQKETGAVWGQNVGKHQLWDVVGCTSSWPHLVVCPIFSSGALTVPALQIFGYMFSYLDYKHFR